MPGVSYPFFKEEICNKLKELCPAGSIALDIGAGAGIYADYLNKHFNMEAIEIWEPTIEIEGLHNKYKEVYCIDALLFQFPYHYDLIILGDVIEHLDVDDAQALIKRCLHNATYVMVAVPYCLSQGPLYGNRYECHRQNLLTPESFNKLYPGFTCLFGNEHYGYYLN